MESGSNREDQYYSPDEEEDFSVNTNIDETRLILLNLVELNAHLHQEIHHPHHYFLLISIKKWTPGHVLLGNK